MLRTAVIMACLIPNAVAAHSGCSFVRTAYTDLGHDGATCAVHNILGRGTSETCQWQFEYRAAEATAFYEHLVADLSACLSVDPTLGQEPDVNHPDSYTAQYFGGMGLSASVSLKDKGQLNATLVSLTLGGPR